MKSENSSNIIYQTGTLMHTAFQTMLENTTDMIFVKNADLVYVAASAAWIKMTGKDSADEVIHHTDLEIFADENLANRYMADDRRLLSEGKNLIDYIEPLTDDNGNARYGSTSKYILSDCNGKALGILGITRDITRDYISRQYYQQELKYLFKLPKGTYAVSYIDVDSWRIISQRRQDIHEGSLQPCHTIEGLCDAALESIVAPNCNAANFYRKFSPSFLQNIYASGKSILAFEYQRRLSNGAIHWIRNTVRFLIDIDSGHLCVMLTAKDIDTQKRKEQLLLMAAKMDKMTMLLNRETTMDYIRKTLATRPDERHVLFMIDVDNFKHLNDTLGHQVGDTFLISLAAELKNSFRETDIVGRIGGDEFFALMKDASDPSLVTKKAQNLLLTIQKVCAQYPSIALSGSIGISTYPENGTTLEQLYDKADNALYQAKGKGKNQFVFSSL